MAAFQILSLEISEDLTDVKRFLGSERPVGLVRPGRPERALRAEGLHSGGRCPLPIFSKFSANFRSFSAVSAPIFASEYAFCSIFQNLPDYLADIFEIWQNFATFAKWS